MVCRAGTYEDLRAKAQELGLILADSHARAVEEAMRAELATLLNPPDARR
jgi:hypothetical protein